MNDRDRLVLGIDQGTSSTKAILVDVAGAIVAHGHASVGTAHPRPGWVEQSPDEIYHSVQGAVAECLRDQDPARVSTVGLSNQRESLVLWERGTGRAIGPLLSWQDQRTVEQCGRVPSDAARQVREVSGMPVDPMFSAPKANWLLTEYDPDRERSERGELCLGTVDSWLLSRLGGGGHVVEVGNAGRTQLMDVRRRVWDTRMLDLFGVPPAVLPEIVSSTGPFPAVNGLSPSLDGVPISAVMGDSHAALFAHAGWRPGQVKATYGTGSSVMGLLPHEQFVAETLCLTVAWEADAPAYAVEGNIRATGATLQWLAEFVGSDVETLTNAAADASSDGLHLVPGFTGLGAPWWDDGAVGVLSGLTLGTQLPQVARAALESIAFQVEDVVSAIESQTGRIDTLLADGGPTSNTVLMQLQADTSGRAVESAETRELSALGAAHLAGLNTGVWTWGDLEELSRSRDSYRPKQVVEDRRRRLAAWHGAVERSRHRPRL